MHTHTHQQGIWKRALAQTRKNLRKVSTSKICFLLFFLLFLHLFYYYIFSSTSSLHLPPPQTREIVQKLYPICPPVRSCHFFVTLINVLTHNRIKYNTIQDNLSLKDLDCKGVIWSTHEQCMHAPTVFSVYSRPLQNSPFHCGAAN